MSDKWTKPEIPDDDSSGEYHREYNERELIALELAESEPGTVCMNPLCLENDDCPHMATPRCNPSGLNRSAYKKPNT